MLLQIDIKDILIMLNVYTDINRYFKKHIINISILKKHNMHSTTY